MTVEAFLDRLEGVRPRGARKWSARCPSHQDRNPSLSIVEGADRILLYCFALCEKREIVAAMRLTMADLFFDVLTPRGQRPAPKPVRIDRVALAFRCELAALDLRLRAERIVEAGKQLNVDVLGDMELDRALTLMGRAHADEARAELFEHVADTLRERHDAERTGALL